MAFGYIQFWTPWIQSILQTHFQYSSWTEYNQQSDIQKHFFKNTFLKNPLICNIS